MGATWPVIDRAWSEQKERVCTVEDIYGLVSHGVIRLKEARGWRWVCPRCKTAPLVLEAGRERRWHFRRMVGGAKHRPDCRFAVGDTSAGEEGGAQGVFDSQRAVDRREVNLTKVFEAPGLPKETNQRNQLTPEDKEGNEGPLFPQQLTRPAYRVRTLEPRTLDDFARYLMLLQTSGISWAGITARRRFLENPVPLTVAVLTSVTPSEVLSEIKKQEERLVFGRVVEINVETGDDHRAGLHLVLERPHTVSAIKTLHIKVPLALQGLIKPGVTVLVRALSFPYEKSIWFRTVHSDYVAVCTLTASDGHKLRSQEEVRIDEFLSDNNIPHDVPGARSKTWPLERCQREFGIENGAFGDYVPDWVLDLPDGPVIVEYYGFAQTGTWEAAQRYRRTRAQKDAFYRQCGYRYLSLEPPNDGDFTAMLMKHLQAYMAELHRSRP